MRAAAVLTCLLLSTVAAAASFREVSQAVHDDQKLIFAGVEPEDVLLRKQCGAAILETDDSPSSFHCVYVQTAKGLTLFSLEDGYLMAEMRARFNVIDGVALQRSDRWAQVQVFNGDKVAAFYIYGDNWIDTEQTEAVYRWLLEQGVPSRNPRGWIGR